MDAHAVALFLFAQLYSRQVQRPEAMEVWPSTSGAGNPAEDPTQNFATPSSMNVETVGPSSPARSNSSTSSQGSARHHTGSFPTSHPDSYVPANKMNFP